MDSASWRRRAVLRYDGEVSQHSPSCCASHPHLWPCWASTPVFLPVPPKLKDLKRQLHLERKRADKLQERLQDILTNSKNRSGKGCAAWETEAREAGLEPEGRAASHTSLLNLVCFPSSLCLPLCVYLSLHYLSLCSFHRSLCCISSLFLSLCPLVSSLCICLSLSAFFFYFSPFSSLSPFITLSLSVCLYLSVSPCFPHMCTPAPHPASLNHLYASSHL